MDDRPAIRDERYPHLLQIESPMMIVNGFGHFPHRGVLRVDAMLDPARCTIAVNDQRIPTTDIRRITLLMEFQPTLDASTPFTGRTLPPQRLEE